MRRIVSTMLRSGQATVIGVLVLVGCSDKGTTQPNGPAHVAVYAGNNQPGLVGYGVNVRPAVQVTDANNKPISGQTVTFAVITGAGSVTSAVVTTNAAGVAQVGQWALGTSPGVNTVTATVTGGSISGNPVTFADTGYGAGYPITIMPYGAGLPPTAQAAFDSAVAKWRRIIYRPLGTASLSAVTAGLCDTLTPALSGSTDGVVIFAAVDSIDGPGKTLAFAGPCYVRLNNSLTIVGVMKFDSADIGGLITAGILNSVVLHEMAHVIGFGPLWGPPPSFIVANCVQLRSTPPGTIQDTYFSCPKAQAQFDSIGGTAYTGGHIVPVENCGTSPYVYPLCTTGTVNGHWRQVVFGNELMVGFLPSNPQLSVVTVAAQEDLGYTVNYAAADPYTHTFTLRAGGGPLVPLGDDLRHGMIYVMDESGKIVGSFRR
ncbi:MAG TPA: leishmanolysin-related zinc metalloendopeptidase [Gemmatimonadales bacterium]|nr:leishmanolysin-related zinc metalloendopeptidase [Gemmatimonadales bacterium]